MRKLTFAGGALLMLLTSATQAQTDQPGRITAFVQRHPALAPSVAAATQADAAAITVRRAAGAGWTDEDVVVTLIAIADQLLGDDRLLDAKRVGEYALAITHAKRLGPGLEFDSLTRIGSVLYNLDDFEGAAQNLDRARQAAAQIMPFDANSVANATANYAVVADNAGRYREAEQALREAISLRAKAQEQRPASIAVAWLSLAGVHKRMGRHDLAEDDYRTALGMLERAGKQNETTYAVALHNYGVLMGELGRDADAEALERRAIDITPPERRHLPSMVNNYTSLAAALSAQGKLDEAERTMADAQRAVAARPKPDGGAVNVLNARATLSARRGNVDAAERDAAGAVALARTILAPDHIRLAEGLLIYADASVRNGKPAQARVAADEAVAISRALSDSNPVKAIAQDTRAAALVAEGNRPGALAASREAAETQARRFADEGGRTPAPLQPEERGIIARRVALLWEQGRP